jgi:hypothetical protein
MKNKRWLMMQTWNDAVEKFSKVTDKLGKPIDQGIFETVICLNLLGVVTRQSCEGHLEWGLPYPWVDFDKEEQQRLYLYQLISQFYLDRQVNSERVLIFHGYRMQSAGAIFAPLLPAEDRAHKFQQYRSEMTDFTLFLKDLVVHKCPPYCPQLSTR